MPVTDDCFTEVPNHIAHSIYIKRYCLKL